MNPARLKFISECAWIPNVCIQIQPAKLGLTNSEKQNQVIFHRLRLEAGPAPRGVTAWFSHLPALSHRLSEMEKKWSDPMKNAKCLPGRRWKLGNWEAKVSFKILCHFGCLPLDKTLCISETLVFLCVKQSWEYSLIISSETLGEIGDGLVFMNK